MADIKSTDLPIPPTRHDFPEVKGKIVEAVEVTVTSEYYGITVRLRDKTTLNFVIEPCVFAFPVYSDFTSGEEKILTKYPPIRSRIRTA
jgi:hypothetical protein